MSLMRKWWTHCPKCDVAFIIDGIDHDIEDPDELGVFIDCPYDDASLTDWNGETS